MLWHYVFFKYEDGFLDDGKIKEMRGVFDTVLKDVAGAKSYEIVKNAVKRDANMDVMVKMELTDEDALKKYLSHPDHVDIGKRYAPHITKIFSFDEAK